MRQQVNAAFMLNFAKRQSELRPLCALLILTTFTRIKTHLHKEPCAWINHGTMVSWSQSKARQFLFQHKLGNFLTNDRCLQNKRRSPGLQLSEAPSMIQQRTGFVPPHTGQNHCSAVVIGQIKHIITKRKCKITSPCQWDPANHQNLDWSLQNEAIPLSPFYCQDEAHMSVNGWTSTHLNRLCVFHTDPFHSGLPVDPSGGSRVWWRLIPTRLELLRLFQKEKSMNFIQQ